MEKVALITGASSGIGLEFAFEVANNFDYNLILVARRLERLEELRKQIIKKHPNIKVYIYSYDLTSGESRNKLWSEILSKNLKVELLINNAGFGSFGVFPDQNITNELKMIDLNIKALIDLTHKALPNMISNNCGYIINVSSMASFQGLPFLSTYAATKAFVTSFSLALTCELEKYGIYIQALCPGPVPTEFGKISGFPSKISITNSISAKNVVKISIRNILKNNLVIPGNLNWLLSQLNRLVPRVLASRLAYLVLKSKFN